MFLVLVRSRCLKPQSQNQCLLILLPPLFHSPSPPTHTIYQDQQTGKHCHVLPQSFRINLKDTSSNISIDSIGLSSLHDFLTDVYIRTWLWEIFKFRALWLKRICKSKNWNQTFLLLSGKTLSLVPIIILKAATNHSFPQVKGEDYENLFQNVLL